MKPESGRQQVLPRRVVIDTNVWLSAALSPGGAPSKVVRRVLASGVPVFSEATFAELESRIWKPKFDRYLSMELRRGILHDVHALAHWAEIPLEVAELQFSRDSSDDKFVHTAIAGQAMWLVSGDQDLLVLEAQTGLRIIAPAQALVIDDFCK